MPGIVRTMMTKSGIAIRYIESDEMIRGNIRIHHKLGCDQLNQCNDRNLHSRNYDRSTEIKKSDLGKMTLVFFFNGSDGAG